MFRVEKNRDRVKIPSFDYYDEKLFCFASGPNAHASVATLHKLRKCDEIENEEVHTSRSTKPLLKFYSCVDVKWFSSKVLA